MASLRQLRSGLFNVQIRLSNSKPLSRSFETRDEAERWAMEKERELRNLPPAKDEEPALSFLSLGERYCNSVLRGRPTRWTTMYRIERIAPHLPEDAKKITKLDVNRYRLMRLEKVAPVTCRDELQLIHRIYRWAHRELILDKTLYPSPCLEIPMPPTSKPRNRVVEPDELQNLLTKLSPTMRAIVEIAYETAMRRSEIIKLTPKVVHLEDRIASVVGGKTGDRSVPLTRRAVELLREAVEGCPAPEARLFPVTPHSVSTAVRRARERVGLDEDVRLHQLRHTRISIVARKGFNQAQIMMVSGHRDSRSVQRYTHLNVRDVVKLMD